VSAAELPRKLLEVPVGFKWFVAGLVDGSPRFRRRGECRGVVSCGATARSGRPDKDGLIACLLAAELTATTHANPAVAYDALTSRFGAPAYRRVDAPATREQKAILAGLSPAQVKASPAGRRADRVRPDPRPGQRRPIGGVKVTTEHGWFAARPSGTEDVYKVYAESFLGEQHLDRILGEAEAVVTAALASAG